MEGCLELSEGRRLTIRSGSCRLGMSMFLGFLGSSYSLVFLSIRRVELRSIYIVKPAPVLRTILLRECMQHEP